MNEEIRPMMMPRGIDRWFEENISWVLEFTRPKMERAVCARATIYSYSNPECSRLSWTIVGETRTDDLLYMQPHPTGKP